MGTRMETNMRRDAYEHLQQLSNTYYNNTKVGTIMGRITNDLFDVTEFAHHCPEEFFVSFIKSTKNSLASFVSNKAKASKQAYFTVASASFFAR